MGLKKILRRLFKSEPSQKEVFLSYRYQRHNQRRLEHLAGLGLDIAGLSVLEVGAGIGDHTSFFMDRDCQIVTSDARPDIVEILRSRYPDVRAVVLDLDNPPETFSAVFDIVYCYGVLYHLKSPVEAIKFMSRCCRKMLLLETCVSFGNEISLNTIDEDRRNPTQSYAGIGCRPTRRWVYDQLKRHFEYVYLPMTQPYHEEFPVDWTVIPRKKTLSRAIFVASRERMKNGIFQEGIPMNQRRS